MVRGAPVTGSVLLASLPITLVVLFWLGRKNLLRGNTALIVASLLLSLLLLPLLLFLFFSVVAYSFKGVWFENAMFVLTLLMGAASVAYGARLRTRVAIPFLTAGVTSTLLLLLVWLLPGQ
jgi:hypothetical protein